MYVVCKEHLVDALDDFLVEYEQTPDVYELKKLSFTDWKAPNKCNYCNEKPKYIVL